MTKKLMLIALFICFVVLATQGQNKHHTLYIFTPDTTEVTRAFPSVGLDSRLSFFNSQSVAFKGIRAGIRFGKNSNRLTVSYRWFSFADDVGLINYDNLLKPFNSRYVSEVDGYYYAVSYQHILHDAYRFAFGVTTDIGLGSSFNSDLSYLQNINIFKRDNRFVPVQLGLYSEYKATRFAGLTAQVGYRHVRNYKMQPSISKLYLGFGVRLYFGSIYRHFRKNNL